jgi:hypothetical protein
MRRIRSVGTVATLAVSATLLLPSAAGAHNNGYAFPARDVRIKQNNLRWVFNRTFPDWGPHVVRCWGLGRTRMRGGAVGYIHIRCRVETMNVPDFIWHINNQGEEFTTRAWP